MKQYNKLWIFVIILLILLLPVNSQVTVFDDSLSRISLSFPQEYETRTYFLRVPNGTVSEARMRLEGFDILGQAILPADIILITDVSGSMDDDCPGGNANPGETPCKINDAKTADISFLNNTNLNYIHVGLVDYSSCPSDPLNIFPLTDDYDALVQEINSYSTQSRTNIGGGMELAMHELLGPRAQPGAPKYMLVMTDGLANNYYSSGGYYAGGSCQSGTTSAQNYVRTIAQQAEDNGITIYGIAFGADADQSLVQEITTNGQLYFAPDADTLKDIYDEIAKNISVQDFPTPTISSTNPVSLNGWEYPSPYSGDVFWDGSSCGTGAATCMDYRALIQQNLDQCSSDPCDIDFSVYSTTVGQLNLSELYIEINEPPVGNYPPLGTCRYETIVCGETEFIVDIDDGSMVTDPNDDLDTLTWVYNSSITSAGGSYFSFNNDYNTIRELNFSIDQNYLDVSYWEVFFFNISDPWGESTIACINVSYEGCVITVECGNGILEPGEECDNGVSNGVPCIPMYGSFCIYCNQTCANITLYGGFCGNGYPESPYEECDDGNLAPGDGCNETCQLEPGITPGCGNGILEPGEQCDDRCLNGIPYVCEPVDNGDGCDQFCMLEPGVIPRCGNGILEPQLGEECDDGCQAPVAGICDAADDGDGCNSTCQLEPTPVLNIEDRTISFDYSAYPGYEYNLTTMLSPYAILPCDPSILDFEIEASTNFEITSPIDPFGTIIIVPSAPDWTTPTSEILEVLVRCQAGSVWYQDTAMLSITYTGGSPFQGSITCEPITPNYMLHEGVDLSIDLDEVFEFQGDYGIVNELDESSSFRIIITPNLPSSFSARSNGLVGTETVQIKLRTDRGVFSDYCPVIFFSFNANCDKEECDACFNLPAQSPPNHPQYVCLRDNDCLDSEILVLNPYTPVRVPNLVPSGTPSNYRIDLFTSLQNDDFNVTPDSGDKDQVFKINGSKVAHGVESAAVIDLWFYDYATTGRICPKLTRLDFDIGEQIYDPVTDLLITGTRAITGYYEIVGVVISKGPYLFTAKVWLRE